MSKVFKCQECGSNSYEELNNVKVRCLQCKSEFYFDMRYNLASDFQISSDATLLDLEKKADLITAPLLKRVLNYFIDVFFILMITGLITYCSMIINKPLSDNESDSLSYILFPIYYIIMEYAFGKTIGKFITKTKVISSNGNSISLAQSFGRLFCRIIPFDAISGLFTKGKFWHDTLPNTLVIEDNFLNKNA